MLQDQNRNWAGNLAFRSGERTSPQSSAELSALTTARDSLKALGTRHSFSSIADTDGTHISTQGLPKEVSIDRRHSTVTVASGVRYGELAPILDAHGLALHNLASLSQISVAGACATATHGSGDGNGCLAAAVRAIEYVDGTGREHRISREHDGERFAGSVVSLGAFGTVTALTLDTVPRFDVRQRVYDGFTLSAAFEQLDAIMGCAYSVSIFTDWRDRTLNQIWTKEKIGDESGRLPPELCGAREAAENRHPIVRLSAANCTEQLGVPGPWHERLPHFRPDFTPSTGNELQSEYFVPRAHGVQALRAIADLSRLIAPQLQISEIRSVAADGLWLSPCYQQHCLGIHFTWKHDLPAVRELLPKIEAVLEPFEPRPHWAKLFSMDAERIARCYPRLPDFRELAARNDPNGRYRNAFLVSSIKR